MVSALQVTVLRTTGPDFAITLDSFADIALLYGLALVLALVLALAVLFRSLPGWRQADLTSIDRIRIGWAVCRYDFWLDLRGVPRRHRRELRTELRANLRDASGSAGSEEAVSALGPLRHMARDAIQPDATRPNWTTGFVAATAVLMAGLTAQFLAALAWVSAAEASAAIRIQGALPLFPGSQMTFERLDSGFATSLQPGWWILLIPSLAFVALSRPWRAFAVASR